MNRDGRLTRVTGLTRTVDEGAVDEKWDELWESFDADGSGTLSYEELVAPGTGLVAFREEAGLHRRGAAPERAQRIAAALGSARRGAAAAQLALNRAAAAAAASEQRLQYVGDGQRQTNGKSEKRD